MKRFKVLVFPAGTEIGLEIHRSLANLKEVDLIGASSSKYDHGAFVFKSFYQLPWIFEADFLPLLNELLENHEVTHIYPAHDDVQLFLMENQTNIKCKVVSCCLDTLRVTRFKSKTYEKFAELLPVPKVFKSIGEIQRYPVFAKPDRGQGSQGVATIESAEQLRVFLKNAKQDYLILEYLPGEEFTVDCFTSGSGELLYCQGRVRSRVKNGIAVHSEFFHSPCFTKFAEIINKNLELRGAWFFQLKKDIDGNFKLLEIGARIGGTMGLSRVKGVNFPLLTLYELERVNTEILVNDFDVVVDKAFINRYSHNLKYSHVYLDLDDFLIVKDKVNLQVIQFIFQCHNKGIPVILLTKHKGNLNETLKKYRLESIFSEIIWVPEEDTKWKQIRHKDAIFLDDSFSERKQVAENLKIPTFDSSSLEMLLDYSDL